MSREDNMAMDDTSALIAFLNARLDEDARDARTAASLVAADLTEIHESTWWENTEHGRVYAGNWHMVVQASANHASVMNTGVLPHIARHDPARVLREVEGKRKLLEVLLNEGHAVLRPGGYTEIYCSPVAEDGEPCECGHDERMSRYARLLALPYDAHPDYRQEWTP